MARCRTASAPGTHPGYNLVPDGAVPPTLPAGSPAPERTEVIGYPLWVTADDPEKHCPAKEFVDRSARDTGPEVWTAAGRSLDNTAVALWYVFGIHHITGPQDRPVMPVDVVSFWLKPFGFFDRNPALDVVATAPDMCHTEVTSAHH